MNNISHNYWIGVVSKEHVMRGVEGGFIMLNHGKRAPLARLKAGDGFVFYSPRVSFPDGAPLQAFTAIGTVKSDEIYQVTMSEDFQPFRRDATFVKCKDAPIKPLIEQLSFITSKTHWGAAFRFGLLKVPREDFELIAQAMQAKLSCP